MVVSVRESRTVPVPLQAAYDGTIVVPLPEIFARRHLLLPPVTKVTEQDGAWGSHVGQSRLVHTSDGGRLRETLTVLERPDRFGYRIEVAAGPLRPAVSHLDGTWSFEPAGADRTTVTWAWELHPRSVLTTPVVALVARTWPGYARRALATLETVLTPR